MRKLAAFVFVFALAVVSFSPATSALASPPKTTSLVVTAIEKGGYSGVRGKLQQVVRTDAEWKKLWEKHKSTVLSQPPLPKVDFSKEMVIALYRGSQTSGGYTVSIVSVEDDGTNIVVTYKETDPSPGGVQLSAITQPFVLARVPVSNKPVKFVKVP
ncbi:MAG: protease complex subunit PrcB family protein [Candidatus Obscuribacterales bacterium]|nr:protease complex subunit PrcB family protein [Candidatus Obscuribacterales bacterium]